MPNHDKKSMYNSSSKSDTYSPKLEMKMIKFPYPLRIIEIENKFLYSIDHESQIINNKSSISSRPSDSFHLILSQMSDNF